MLPALTEEVLPDALEKLPEPAIDCLKKACNRISGLFFYLMRMRMVMMLAVRAVNMVALPFKIGS